MRNRRIVAAIPVAVFLIAAVFSTPGASQSSWVGKAPMPAPRYTHAAAVLNGAVHIVGGADLSTCSVLTAHDVYDPVNDAWTSAAPMSTPRAHPGAAVLNDGTKDLLYVVGGASGCGVKADTMEAYDPGTNSWTAKASMPAGGRNSMGVAVIDNRLYVVGGIKTGEIVTEIGEMYNPITDTWSPIASMPTVRYAMAVGAIDGILYVAGGGNDIASFTAMDAYDPATNTWTSKAPISTVRAYVASVVVDGRLYAIGGQNSANLSSVEIYNPATDSWSAGPALPAARSLMPAVNVGGRIYVTGGGYTNAGLFGDTLMLADAAPPVTTATLSPSPNGNGWNNSDPIVTLSATHGAGGSAVASIVYSLTGAQSGGATVAGSSTSFAITNEGTTTVTYHASDATGNVEADGQLVVKLDKTNPTLPGLPNVTATATSSAGAVVTFSVVGSDALSGIVSTQFSPKSSGMTFPIGVTHETVTVMDAAGNVAIGGFEVTVNPVPKTLVSVEVSPASASVTPGQNQQFQAIGHFSDGTTQPLLSGNGGGGLPTGPSNPSWSVQMTPPIDVNACATPQTSTPLVFSSQGFFDQSGSIHTTWSPGTPVVNVDGTINPSTVSLTLTCTTNSTTGSIVAAWTGTRYQGTYSFNGVASAGSISITGWSAQAAMPAPRFSHAAASVNGNVYVFGGGNPGQPSPVLKYVPGTNTWSTLGNMPTSREGLGAATINGLIYVVGGHVSGGIASGVLEAYDASSDSWITGLAPMPTPRAHLAVVTDGAFLYALGGDTLGSNSGVVATVERYNPVANSWSTLASMPTAGNFVVAGVLNNTIVVAGAGNSSNTDVYDIATNLWHSGAPMPAVRSLAAAGVANGGMYVVGGTVNGSPMYPSWVYYPATNQTPDYWSGPTSIPTARSQLATAVVDDVIYAIGGLVAGSNPPAEVATNEALSTPPAYTFSPFSGNGSGGSTPTVQWQSSNPSVAGVDNSGNAHANAVGQVTITAAASTGVSCATTNTCATLNVIDNTAPNVFVPPNRTVEANNPGGANNVTFFASSFDSADGSRRVDCTWTGGSASFFPPSFSGVIRSFPFGTTSVSCAASDTSGNTGHASFTITVRDTLAPFVNVPSQFMTRATSAAGATVNVLGPVSAFDSVDGQVTPSCTPATGSTFPIGSTLVSCTATDAHGNTSVPKTFTVQVADRLTLQLPANIAVDAIRPAGVAVTFSVSATYFLGGSEPVQCFIITGFVGGDPQIGAPVSSGATFPVGTTTVGCLANYPSGGHEGGFFTVTVTLLSAQQIIAKVAAQAAAINYAQGSGLLQNALASLNAGQISIACDQLAAYSNQIQAQTGKKISAADAAALTDLVSAARESMGC